MAENIIFLGNFVSGRWIYSPLNIIVPSKNISDKNKYNKVPQYLSIAFLDVLVFKQRFLIKLHNVNQCFFINFKSHFYLIYLNLEILIIINRISNYGGRWHNLICHNDAKKISVVVNI